MEKTNLMEMTTNCPICASKNSRLLAEVHDYEMATVAEKFKYFCCEACDGIFINPFPIDRLAEIYPTTYYSNEKNEAEASSKSFLFWLKEKLDARVLGKVLKNIPGESLNLLDVGGGTGWMLDVSRKADPRVGYTAVVDLNEQSRKLAEASGHSFHCQTIETFKSDKKFDLVVMLNLIEHVADPGFVLEKMAHLLTPGGRILIKTPNTRTLDRYLFQHQYWGGYHCPRHWVIFNLQNFTDLAKKNGLEVDWSKYTQGAPQWATSVLGSLAKRKKFVFPAKKTMLQNPLLPLLFILFAAVDFIRRPFSPTAQMIILLKKQ